MVHMEHSKLANGSSIAAATQHVMDMNSRLLSKQQHHQGSTRGLQLGFNPVSRSVNIAWETRGSTISVDSFLDLMETLLVLSVSACFL